jgi:hypothetical protein
MITLYYTETVPKHRGQSHTKHADVLDRGRIARSSKQALIRDQTVEIYTVGKFRNVPKIVGNK